MSAPLAPPRSFARRLAGFFPLCALALVLLAPPASAQTVVKIATVMPAGSPWATMLSTIAAQWKTVSGGQVTLKAYAGGTMGDENDSVKKMGLSQLHAGALTTTGLAAIDTSALVLDLPLFVRSKGERDHLLSKMAPVLEKNLNDKGYVVLAWTWLGQTKLFSTQRTATLADARKTKLFCQDGFPDVQKSMQVMGFKQVVLSFTDLVPSFTTGMIDAVFLPSHLALALTLHAKAKYETDLAWSMLDGAFIIRKDVWATFAPDLQTKLKKVVVEAAAKVDLQIQKLSSDAETKMKSQGLQVVPVTDPTEWTKAVDGAVDAVRGKFVPADIYDLALSTLKAYRAAQAP